MPNETNMGLYVALGIFTFVLAMHTIAVLTM